MDKAKLERKIKEGKGSFQDLHKLSTEAGRELSAAVMQRLNEEFPNGNISEGAARQIVRPLLLENHAYISEMSAEVINVMYRKTDVGLKAITPKYSIDRENDIVKEIVDWSRRDEPEQG